MCILLYTIMYRNMLSDAKKSYLNVLENVTHSVDSEVNDLNKFSMQLANTAWVKKIAYMQGNKVDYDRVDVFMLQEYSQQFVNYKTINNFIDEIAVYFQGKDLVISSLGQNDFNTFSRNIFYTEQTDLPSIINSRKPPYFLHLNISTYGQARTGYIFVQTVPIFGLKDNVTLLFFIKEKSFRDIIQPLLISESSQVSIADQQGESLFVFDSAKKGSADAPRQTFRIEMSSQSNGWHYSVDIPKSTLTLKKKNLTLYIALLLILSGLVGWLLSSRLANSGYKPLANLIAFIQNRSGEDVYANQKNEFAWLQNTLHSLFEQEERVNERLAQQQPIIKDAYLKRLIEGDFEINPQLQKALELLELSFPYPFYACCVIMDHPSGLPWVTISSLGESDRLKIYTTEYAGNTVLLCNYEDANRFYSFLETFSALADEADNGHFALSAGGEGSDLHALSQSYQQARKAMEYRFVNAGQSLIKFEDIDSNEKSYYYPPDAEYRLTNYLKSGDYKNAESLYEEIWNANINKKNLSPTALKNFLIHAELTLLKIIKEKEMEKIVPTEPHTVLSFPTINESDRYLRNLFQAICGHIQEIQHSKDNELKRQILQYVNDHLTDPSLSLSAIADYHHISTSYLSRFYKEYIGCNFLDDISRQRIELAKRLLSDDKIEIKSISKKVGYDNDVTFRRLFKKYEGITPSQYRWIQNE